MKIPQHKLLEYSQSVNLNINLQVRIIFLTSYFRADTLQKGGPYNWYAQDNPSLHLYNH